MPTYLDLTMERNHHAGVNYRLKVEETVNIGSNSSTLNYIIQYKNASGKLISSYTADYTIEINGNKLVDSTAIQALEASADWRDSGDTRLRGSLTVAHRSDGSGSASISVSIKADELLGYYRTSGGADTTLSLTEIDLSSPTLSNFKISADRYGLNASTSFTAAHTSYALSKIRFELKCLTEVQAKQRVGKVTQADSSSYVYDVGRNAYTLILEKTVNLTKSNSITLDLDCIDEKSHPLNSGAVYEYGVILTAANGKTYTKLGRFTVPQKVTGVTCDSVLNITQGESAQLNYTVSPLTAQLQAVTFTSSDTAVATADKNGIITAKKTSAPFATAVITIKTTDGGYTAKCTVNVSTSAAFPYISEVTRFFSAEDFLKIISAIAIVRTELIESGAEVASLSGVNISGKNCPVQKILPACNNVEADCQKLKAAAAKLGLSTSPLPASTQKFNKQNSNWLIVINNWINFLNNVHNQLK